MEVPEVNEGLYLVFDAEGREADVVADRWDVRLASWSKPSPERLRPLLEAYLSNEGIAGPTDQPLSELVVTAARVARERQLGRIWPNWLGRLIARSQKRRS
jgi:hypothetical protein